MKEKVLIVGAGVAGLAAGIYAQKNGFDTTILERHTLPGGNCTAWRREGYLFDGCIRWLSGSAPELPLYKIWQEVGALPPGLPVYKSDPFLTVDAAGQRVCLYRDVNKLEKHWLEVSPEDAPAIHRLCKDIRKFRGFGMPVMNIRGVKLKEKSKLPAGFMMRMMRALPRMNALGKRTVEEYTAQFSHPGIRLLLNNMVTEGNAASTLLFALGGLAMGDGVFPEGGSLAMALRMAKRYEELGGKIEYNAKVEKVFTEKGMVKGVTVNGVQREAAKVVLATDTLRCEELFNGPLQEPWMEKMKQNTEPVTCTILCLGVASDLSHLPEVLIWPLEEAFEYGGKQLTFLGLHNFAKHKDFAPKGGTALTMELMVNNYAEWEQARQDGTYEEKKKRLATALIERLEKKLPEIQGKVAVWDVATPVTFERYCGTLEGSWMSTMGPGKGQTVYPGKAESVNGLYFAGQRLMLPGGLPPAVSSGRMAVQYICRDAGVMFVG